MKPEAATYSVKTLGLDANSVYRHRRVGRSHQLHRGEKTEIASRYRTGNTGNSRSVPTAQNGTLKKQAVDTSGHTGTVDTPPAVIDVLEDQVELLKSQLESDLFSVFLKKIKIAKKVDIFLNLGYT